MTDPESGETVTPDDLLGMTENERAALPAEHHRPVFDGLGVPHSWLCAVCWGDGWTTAWPCSSATRGGVALAKSLGVEFTS